MISWIKILGGGPPYFGSKVSQGEEFKCLDVLFTNDGRWWWMYKLRLHLDNATLQSRQNKYHCNLHRTHLLLLPCVKNFIFLMAPPEPHVLRNHKFHSYFVFFQTQVKTSFTLHHKHLVHQLLEAIVRLFY